MKWLILCFLLTSPAYASTVPQFTRGTMTSRTEASSTVSETIVIENYSTGSSYTMSGHNIQWNGTPGPGTSYTMVTPGAATQFSETSLLPGLASVTTINRTTTIESVTTSTSVFTQ